MHGHSSFEQDQRLLSELRVRKVSSIEAANKLDIVHPPSTIRRLRNRGHDIVTHWIYQATDEGRRPHRVALYVLLREAS